MITLRRYNPIDGISLKVEVTPSITCNPTVNHHDISTREEEIDIEIRYMNYLEGEVIEQRTTFKLAFQLGVSWENIYEGGFRDDVNDELDDEIDVIDFARPTVIDAIARGYVGMVKNNVNNVGPCSRAMLVNIEVDEFDEDVQGISMDLEEDSYNTYNLDDNNGGNIDDNIGHNNKVEEIRAILGRCGVSFGKEFGLSSSGAHCAICLADEVVGAEVVMLPCHHVFHGDCIIDLVVKGADSHASCPLCRSRFY